MLAGKSGRKDERRDSLGRPIFDEDAEQEVKGVDLYLTLDINVQKAVMDALETGVRFTGANNASAIVMDPKTGAIRAMATYPSFDRVRLETSIKSFVFSLRIILIQFNSFSGKHSL